eukprot:15473513-Alexandrium_andersonii.AAC.1
MARAGRLQHCHFRDCEFWPRLGPRSRDTTGMCANEHSCNKQTNKQTNKRPTATCSACLLIANGAGGQIAAVSLSR